MRLIIIMDEEETRIVPIVHRTLDRFVEHYVAEPESNGARTKIDYFAQCFIKDVSDGYEPHSLGFKQYYHHKKTERLREKVAR